MRALKKKYIYIYIYTNCLKRGKTRTTKSRVVLVLYLIGQRVARVFWTNHRAKQTNHRAKYRKSKSIAEYFRHSVEISLFLLFSYSPVFLRFYFFWKHMSNLDWIHLIDSPWESGELHQIFSFQSWMWWYRVLDEKQGLIPHCYSISYRINISIWETLHLPLP